MAAINFECVICSKICQNSEEIVSTNCGHVFHDVCLKQKHEGLWFSSLRKPQCPQCLRDVNTTTKLLFKFGTEPSQRDTQILELNYRLSQLRASRDQLQQQYEASERNLRNLQMHIQSREQEFIGLKNRLDFQTQQTDQLKKEIANKNDDTRKLSEEKVRSNSLQQKFETTQKKFLNLQNEYNKKDRELNQVNKKLEQVQTQNKQLSKDISAKTTEIQKLQEGNEQNSNTRVPSAAFEAQIEVLNEKIKQISIELANEIRNSSQIALEKYKLEKLLAQLKSQTAQISKGATIKTGGKQVVNGTMAKTDEASVGPKATTEGRNKDSVPSVVIRNVKETFADKAIMREYFFKLLNIMDLNMAGDDVLDISYLDGRFLVKTDLVITFKTFVLRDLFLSNANKLKGKPESKHLIVQEYIVTDSTPKRFLYQQALSLKCFGYKKVYMKNNTVFVSKSKNSEVFKISCTADIDKLRNEAKTVTEIKK